MRVAQTSMADILVCGIDDFATEKQLMSGWTYFVLPLSALADFCRQAAGLLTSGLSEFHAKVFKTRETAASEKFVCLIRETIDRNEYSMVRVNSSSAQAQRRRKYEID